MDFFFFFEKLFTIKYWNRTGIWYPLFEYLCILCIFLRLGGPAAYYYITAILFWASFHQWCHALSFWLWFDWLSIFFWNLVRRKLVDECHIGSDIHWIVIRWFKNKMRRHLYICSCLFFFFSAQFIDLCMVLPVHWGWSKAFTMIKRQVSCEAQEFVSININGF